MRSGERLGEAGLGSPAENCASKGIAMTAGEPFALKILRGANQKGIMGINALESHLIPPLAPNTINPMRGDERSRPRAIINQSIIDNDQMVNVN